MAAQPIPSPAAAPAASREAHEQRFTVHGVSWAHYLAMRAMLDDHAGLRMTYYRGTLELMSPSRLHETIKKKIARLVELYAVSRGVRLHGYGSTTYRREAKERGLEPDECYYVGEVDGEFPHIAIEVALTSGGIDKLLVYAGLGVREVWFWRSDRLEVHSLEGEAYVDAPRSALLPKLDLEELARFVRMPDQADAAKAYLELLSRGG